MRRTPPPPILLALFKAVLRIRIHRIHMFLGLLDPNSLVRFMVPDPDPFVNSF
jgi:hypothetical protein